MGKFFEPEKIVVVGCGGTGSYLIAPLCRYLASKSFEYPIVLVDGDKYSESNLNRQEFSPRQVGMNKADAMVELINARLKGITALSFPLYVGTDSVSALIPEKTIVFGCVDNHVCRKVISDRCKELQDVCFISCGNELTDGNIQLHLRVGGKDITPPIETRHPEIVTAQDGDRSKMSCEELANLPSGGQVILSNMTSACIGFQMFYMFENSDNMPVEIYFDILSAKTRRVENGKEE